MKLMKSNFGSQQLKYLHLEADIHFLLQELEVIQKQRLVKTSPETEANFN